MNTEKPPASIFELVAALTALGAYLGANTAAEHAAEAARLEYHPDFYRVILANALLGVAEKEAVKAVTDAGPEDGAMIAQQQTLRAAGVMGSSADLLQFLRWRALRLSLPLQQMVKDGSTGAIPLAAAWATEGLQLLLGFLADAQHFTQETISRTAVTADLQAARAALSAALEDVDLMLKMVAAAK